MKRKRFTEGQIIGVLKEAEAGAKTGPCTAAWHIRSDELQLEGQVWWHGLVTVLYRSPISLGSRLVQSQNATAAARLTADRKFLASLSYRVATRRKSLRRQNMASTRQRSL